MSEQNWMTKAGATPRKLMLIAVLAVVLVAVIVSQLPGSSTAAPQLADRNSSSAQSLTARQRPNAARKSQSEAASSTTTPTTNPSTNAQPTRTWPKLPMVSILSYDPFATPDWLSLAHDTEPSVDEAERQQRKEEILQRLREQGAQAIVFSGSDKLAAIGDQSLRIGETIEGFRISDITREGVILTEFETH